MQPLHREVEAAEAAREAAMKAFMEGTDDDWLAAARAAGLAAHRAERIVFGDNQAARLADARARAQAAACSLRIAARLVTEYTADPPRQDRQPAVRISPTSGIPLRWCDLAAATERAAACGDADSVYEAALHAEDEPGFVLDLIGRTNDLEAAEAACPQHRHHTDTRTNLLDAAHWIRHVALRVTALAASDRGDFLPDLRACCRKVRHGSIEEAEKAAEGGRSLRGVRLRVYRCDICGGWHLTSRVQAGTLRS